MTLAFSEVMAMKHDALLLKKFFSFTFVLAITMAAFFSNLGAMVTLRPCMAKAKCRQLSRLAICREANAKFRLSQTIGDPPSCHSPNLIMMLELS